MKTSPHDDPAKVSPESSPSTRNRKGGLSHSVPMQFVHFWTLVASSFVKNRCPARASALAYTTLLSLIPVLAVMVSVTTTFLKQDGQKRIGPWLDQMVSQVAPALNLVEDPDAKSEGAARQAFVEKIMEYISNVQSGTLGAVSAVGLILVAVSLFGTVEGTINDIWGVEKGRKWLARLMRYWAVLTLGPVFLVGGIAFTTTVHLEMHSTMLARWPLTGILLYRALPFILLILGFACFYRIVPNTSVNWSAALVGGMMGGGFWQLNNMFSAIFVSNVATYNKIFGGISVIPIFLVGLYVSWLIILLGAQVAYAFQNRGLYLQDRVVEKVDQATREKVAIGILLLVGRRFSEGNPPPDSQEFARVLCVPSKLITRMLPVLIQSGLLTSTDSDPAAYLPARPLERITVDHILEALRRRPESEALAFRGAFSDVVEKAYEEWAAASRDNAAQVTLSSLMERCQDQNPVLESSS